MEEYQDLLWTSICAMVYEAINCNASQITVSLDQNMSLVVVEDNGECFDELKFKFLKRREALLYSLSKISCIVEFESHCNKKSISRTFENGKETQSDLKIEYNSKKKSNTVLRVKNILNSFLKNDETKNLDVGCPYILCFLNEIAYLHRTCSFHVILNGVIVLDTQPEYFNGTKPCCKIVKSMNLLPAFSSYRCYTLYGYLSNTTNIRHQVFFVNQMSISSNDLQSLFSSLSKNIIQREKQSILDCDCWVHSKTEKEMFFSYTITVECANNLVALNNVHNEATVSFECIYDFKQALCLLILDYLHKLHDFETGRYFNILKQSTYNKPPEPFTFSVSSNIEKFARQMPKNCFMNVPYSKECFNLLESTVLQNDIHFENEHLDRADSVVFYNQKHVGEGVSFSKELFRQIEVIGQLDQKFIATVHRVTEDGNMVSRIILFDQHASDERVQLEMLFAEHRSKDGHFYTSHLQKGIELTISSNELTAVLHLKTRLREVGILFDLDESNTCIIIMSIPTVVFKLLCFNWNKVCSALNEILKYEISFLMENGYISRTTPVYYHNLLCQEACKRAVKFGQTLSTKQMSHMLNNLSKCNAPFQCAHGRPSLTLLSQLKTRSHKNCAPNFSNLLSYFI